MEPKDNERSDDSDLDEDNEGKMMHIMISYQFLIRVGKNPGLPKII